MSNEIADERAGQESKSAGQKSKSAGQEMTRRGPDSRTNKKNERAGCQNWTRAGGDRGGRGGWRMDDQIAGKEDERGERIPGQERRTRARTNAQFAADSRDLYSAYCIALEVLC